MGKKRNLCKICTKPRVEVHKLLDQPSKKCVLVCIKCDAPPHGKMNVELFLSKDSVKEH